MPTRRKSYTISAKVDVVEWLRSNGRNLSKAEREFGISRKQIRSWDREFEKLKSLSEGKSATIKRNHPGGDPKSVELNDQVFDWFTKERDHGRDVRNFAIQDRAREVALQLKVSPFIASAGWLSRWKSRYNIGFHGSTNDFHKVKENSEEKIIACSKTDLATIPGGSTSFVQPMDTHVNTPLNTPIGCQLKRMKIDIPYNEWLRMAERMKHDNSIQSSKQSVVNCTSKTREDIGELAIIEAFLPTDISNAVNGGEEISVEDNVPSVNSDRDS